MPKHTEERDARGHLTPPVSGEVIHVWPCGTWCYQEDLSEMLTFMSDDFETFESISSDQHGSILVRSIQCTR